MENRSPQLVVMIIWAGLLMAVFTYAVIASVGLAGGEPSAAKPDASLAQTLAWVAAAVSGASLALRPMFLGGFRRGTVSLETPAGRSRFMAGNIVCFALAESVAIFGLILALQGNPQETWLVFFAVAIVLMVIHIPLPGRFVPKRLA